MNRLSEFKAYVKTNPMELDVLMSEVYQSLTSLKNDFVMFDGGAHKGWHTLRMANLPGCGTVYSVEADPAIGDVLAANLGKWITGDMPDVQILRKALQNDPAVTSIPWMSSHSHVGRSSIKSGNTQAPTIWTDHTIGYRAEVSVAATTIDLILASETRDAPFIKLDLEGADFLALQGAEEIMRQKRPVIAFENADKAPAVHGYTIQDMSDFFTRLGYVALNYVGEPLVSNNWFDFYEAWAVPLENYSQVHELIGGGVDRRL